MQQAKKLTCGMALLASLFLNLILLSGLIITLLANSQPPTDQARLKADLEHRAQVLQQHRERSGQK